MPLTPDVIATVQATAPVVAENALKITKTFYETMFANNPEVLAFFNKSHQKKSQQPRALADAVIAYASNIDNLAPLTPLVAKMAHRHCALSVKPEHYGVVHKNLMIAIGNVLGEAVTPEIANAWSEAVLALAEIMTGAEEELYQKNESRKGGWRYEREFELVAKETVAEDTVRFEFKPTDGHSDGFEFDAGQYVTVRCDNGEAPRHYTITSPPGAATIEICTRKLAGGAVSTYMHDTLQVGEKVLLGAPCGIFTVPEDVSEAVLVSAGIGITPMLAFLQHLGADKVKASLHIERNAGRNGLGERFAAAGVTNATTIFTSEGRPDLADQAEALIAKAGTDATYFLCGPTLFMSDFTEALKAKGVDESKIKREVFGTGTVKSNNEAAKETSGDSALAPADSAAVPEDGAAEAPL